jgi:hypothetical protein
LANFMRLNTYLAQARVFEERNERLPRSKPRDRKFLPGQNGACWAGVSLVQARGKTRDFSLVECGKQVYNSVVFGRYRRPEREAAEVSARPFCEAQRRMRARGLGEPNGGRG